MHISIFLPTLDWVHTVFQEACGWFTTVVPKLIQAVTPIKVVIMSYCP